MPTPIAKKGDLDNCLCSALQVMGSAVKADIINMLTLLKTQIQAAKVLVQTYNIDWSDQGKLLLMQAELTVVQTITQPVVNAVKTLSKLLQPYSDCAPNQTLIRNLKKVTDEVNAPAKSIEDDIERLQNAMDQRNKQLEFFDIAINMIQSWIDAVSDYCP